MTRVFASPRSIWPPASHSTAIGTRELSRTPRRFSCPGIKLLLTLGRLTVPGRACNGFIWSFFISAPQMTHGAALDDDSPDGLPLARLPMLRERLETNNGTQGQEHDDGQ